MWKTPRAFKQPYTSSSANSSCVGIPTLSFLKPNLPTMITNHVVDTPTIPRKSLKNFQGNLKKPNPEEVKQLAERIVRKGFSAPIFIWHDHDGLILDGHQRLKALDLLAKKNEILPDDCIPVVAIRADTIEEAKEKVAEYNSRYSEIDPDFARDWFVGCDLGDVLIPNLELTPIELDADKELIEDDVPAVEEEARIVQRGDIFQLGKHTLMCGDSTNASDIQALMGDVKANMVFTDPPYNVNYHGTGANTSSGIMNDRMTDQAFASFLQETFARYRECVTDSAALYVFHSASTQIAFEHAMSVNGFEVRAQLVWNKPSASLGWGDYRYKHEPCFYASVAGKSPAFYGDRTHATVIDFAKSDQELLRILKHAREAERDGRTTVWSMKREPVGEYVHPTQKPVELVGYAIRNSSKSGETVLDLFAGSGSTLIACEKLGRECRTMELDPRYVETVIRRYSLYVGGKATIKCVNRDMDLSLILK